MIARYELVAIDAYNNGKVIETKTGTKLTLQEIDLFTTKFSSPEHITYYLQKKGLSVILLEAGRIASGTTYPCGLSILR